MEVKLKTRCGDLTFTLETKPKVYPEGGPVIAVHDRDFTVGSYCLSTLACEDEGFRDEHQPLDGWCVSRGRYEKYRAVDAKAHKALVAEAKRVLRRVGA